MHNSYRSRKKTNEGFVDLEWQQTTIAFPTDFLQPTTLSTFFVTLLQSFINQQQASLIGTGNHF